MNLYSLIQIEHLQIMIYMLKIICNDCGGDQGRGDILINNFVTFNLK